MALLSIAAKQLDDLLRMGYPEEVAQRIVSGDLPMDTASRMERAEAMGFDPSNIAYHGTRADITEFNPSSRGKMGPGIYTSPSARTAGLYSTPGHRIPASGIYDDRGVLDEELLYNQGANVMPLLLRGERLGRSEALKQNPDITMLDLSEPATDGTNELAARLGREGFTGLEIRGGLVGDRFDDSNVISEVKEQNTFDPRDIRSYLSAAFDPEYKGPNILGQYALPAVGAGLLAAAPEDAEAGFVNRGGRTLLEAFHGSPHKFDRFSTDAIGTGEGAQAYGHGLYFADSEDVARGYRDALTANATVDMANNGDPAEWAAHLVRMHGGEEKAKLVLAGDDGSKLAIRPQRQEAFDAIESGSYKNYKLPEGALYRAEIDVTPDQLLDWDKPLSEQSEGVRDILRNNEGLLRNRLYTIGDNFEESYADGSALYNAVKRELRGDNPASFLSDLGIEGIRYLDRQSRNKPLRDIRNEFLAQLPEDAEISDVIEMLDDGAFTDANASFLNALAEDDWLGFDYPAQAISAALSDNISNYDASKGLKDSVSRLRDNPDNTSNYVIFDDSKINIADRYAINPMFAPSQDRALDYANRGLIDAATVDEQRIAQHQRDVNEQMAQLGLLADPMYEYGDIIPAKTNIATGETSLAFPGIVRDVVGGLLDLANMRRSGVYNPQAVMDVAL